MPAESSVRQPDRHALLDLVSSHYSAISRGLLGPLLDLLSLSRQACGGDVDKFLIMLVVAIRTSEHPLFATYTQAQLMTDVPVFPSLGTNVRSVAESIGAPRETVRRKVGELVDTGWIAREGKELRFTMVAYRQLAGARASIARLAVRNFEVVDQLIRAQARDGGDDS